MAQVILLNNSTVSRAKVIAVRTSSRMVMVFQKLF